LITQRKEHGDNDLRISGGVGKQFYDNLSMDGVSDTTLLLLRLCCVFTRDQ